jgi:hypothetical protein
VSDRLRDRLWTGHLSLVGHRVVIYGANAMHWAVNVRFLGSWWCFHPPTNTFGGKWPWYFYVSPDATPAAAWGFGPGFRGDRL